MSAGVVTAPASPTHMSATRPTLPPPAAHQGGDEPLALYVHWPFCKAKCPYCDFNSHVREQIDHVRWGRALGRELQHLAGSVGRRSLGSIFFGGGTPSLMAPTTVATIIDEAARLFGLGDGIEITLEANPTSVEAASFAQYRSAGVNRVSLGIQALEDRDLRLLGREHSVAEALAALELAARWFERWSFDLIYARPGQTAAGWELELGRALDLLGGHLSAYQLTIEEGTRFHALHRDGRLVVPDEDIQADLYELTQALLEEAGLPAYEISNHARPGEESRHTLVYWRYGDYAGIGPGAHGRLSIGGAKLATVAERVPERWLRAVEVSGTGQSSAEIVPPDAQVTEALMMGLRLREGVPLARLERLAGAPWQALLEPARVGRLADAGYLAFESDALRATRAGRQRLNALLTYLLVDGPRDALPPPPGDESLPRTRCGG